jgi:hypothetical protein
MRKREIVSRYRQSSGIVFISAEKEKKWSRENLNKYIEDDRLKWKYADKNQDKNLTREEFEFFHHPREHEAMSEYIAVV